MTDKPTTTIEFFVAVNQDGEFMIDSSDVDSAIGELQQTYSCDAIRTFGVQATVELPTLETVTVDVPAPAEAPVTATAE